MGKATKSSSHFIISANENMKQKVHAKYLEFRRKLIPLWRQTKYMQARLPLRRLASVVGLEPSARHALSTGESRSCVDCSIIFPSETIARQQPAIYGAGIPWQYEDRQTTVTDAAIIYTLENVHVWGGGAGAIIDCDGALLIELSPCPFGPRIHEACARPFLPRSTFVGGTVAYVGSSAAGDNYGHFLWDLLPKFKVLEQAGYPVEKLDYIVVNHQDKSWQLELLRQIGVPANKIIRADEKLSIKADRVIAVDARRSHEALPLWALEYIRERFGGWACDAQHSKRLFWGRADTNFRRLLNEEELAKCLGELGFEYILAKQYSLPDQINMMANAEIVIGPHGAALSNLIFAREGAVFVEICSPRYITGPFWTIAQLLRLDHHLALGDRPLPPFGVDPRERDIDFAVSIETVMNIVKKTLSGR